MKKKGFTLVELLAVIVILGIIMAVVGVSLSKPKKEAHIREVQKMEETIKGLGADVYINNRKKFSGSSQYKVSLFAIKDYLKNIDCNVTEKECYLKNPSSNNYCEEVYLLIDTTNEKNMFSSYIKCDNLYETTLPSEVNLDEYSEINELN